MTRTDQQVLFAALGFLAVLVKGDNAKQDGASRAISMAKLIEAFCEASLPEIAATRAASDKADVLDKLIDLLKDNLNETHEARLPEDMGTLRGIYERLIQRHRTYADDSQIADAILYFLEEENTHTKEANMMIVRVQGENDIFAPCQRMATAIAEALKSKGSCTQSDVAAKGFSAEEIKRQWAMAFALAKVELNWMDA